MSVVSTLGTFWFILWRSVLLGLGLGAWLGAFYGFVVGSILFPVLGSAIGLILGIYYGAMTGPPLGIMQGATLCGITLLLHPCGVSGDVDQYRRIAGRACAVVCVLAAALFWGVTFWRSGNDSFSVQVAFTRDLPEALIIVVGPSLVATGAAWWTGRKVAGQFA